MATQTRDRLHKIIDQLPDSELNAVARFLEYIRDTADPVHRALLNAPEDDESLTPEEEAAIEEGIDALNRGDVVSTSELRRELGL